MNMVAEGERNVNTVLWRGLTCTCDCCVHRLLQKIKKGYVNVCEPVLSSQQADMYNKRAFANPRANSHFPPNIPYSSPFSSAAPLIYRSRASAPPSTSESCCL